MESKNKKLLLTMDEAAEALNISRSMAYQLKRTDKRFPYVNIGTRVLVPEDALKEFIALLLEEQRMKYIA